MVFNLSAHDTIANAFLAELRDRTVQPDRMRFRKNLERLGQIMAYEVSRRLSYRPRDVETPLGLSRAMLPAEEPVLFTVLRAGLPFFQGFLDFFDRADCGFIGAFRREGGEELTVQLDYTASPPVTGKSVIVLDPMLATGKSVVRAVNAILKHGSPMHLHLVSVVAVQEGIDYVNRHIEVPFTLSTCTIDQRLDERFYIVPGLGDAGDLSFGEKL